MIVARLTLPTHFSIPTRMQLDSSTRPPTARGGVPRATALAVLVALLWLVMRELLAFLRAQMPPFSPWPRAIAYGLAGALVFGLLSGWIDRDPWKRAGVAALVAALVLGAIGWWASVV